MPPRAAEPLLPEAEIAPLAGRFAAYQFEKAACLETALFADCLALAKQAGLPAAPTIRLAQKFARLIRERRADGWRAYETEAARLTKEIAGAGGRHG